MAEDRRMTAAQAVDKLMASASTPMCCASASRWWSRELMEAEVAGADRRRARRARAGAASRSATAIGRAGVDTRVGEIELAIPKLRSGQLLPELPGAAQARRAGAGRASSQEAYVNGVSTRKVDRLVEQLGVAA